MSFHLDTLSSFGIQANHSEAEIELVEAFERLHAIKLPASVREWYCLDDWPGILNQITRTPHRPVRLAEANMFHFNDGTAWASTYPLTILEENQGVWHMAIVLTGHSDPPVAVRYNESAASWHRHVDSFSDWIFAWLWDNAVIAQGDDSFIHVRDEDALARELAASTQAGPTTYHVGSWLQAERIFRVLKDGLRQNIVFDTRW